MKGKKLGIRLEAQKVQDYEAGALFLFQLAVLCTLVLPERERRERCKSVLCERQGDSGSGNVAVGL